MKHHRATRAIVMAAGKGTRLLPYTLDTPKPLLKVHGQRMIDSIICGLHRHGIREIYVVTGYLKEQFSSLPGQYPGVVLLHNPYYEEANNISSLYVARAQLEDVIILDGDQLICEDAVLSPSFRRSCYCSFYQHDATQDEWILELENDVITRCHRTGGRAGYQLQSVSFWTKEDGEKLKMDVEALFMREKRLDLFWDDIALFERPEHYRLGIREVREGDIVEIDTVDDFEIANNLFNVLE